MGAVINKNIGHKVNLGDIWKGSMTGLGKYLSGCVGSSNMVEYLLWIWKQGLAWGRVWSPTLDKGGFPSHHKQGDIIQFTKKQNKTKENT